MIKAKIPFSVFGILSFVTSDSTYEFDLWFIIFVFLTRVCCTNRMSYCIDIAEGLFKKGSTKPVETKQSDRYGRQGGRIKD